MRMFDKRLKKYLTELEIKKAPKELDRWFYKELKRYLEKMRKKVGEYAGEKCNHRFIYGDLPWYTVCVGCGYKPYINPSDYEIMLL